MLWLLSTPESNSKKHLYSIPVKAKNLIRSCVESQRLTGPPPFLIFNKIYKMIRLHHLDQSVEFFTRTPGFVETRRKENEAGRFTLVFFATAPGEPEFERTSNWDQEEGRNFGHLASSVENIYEYCRMLMDKGVTILRPPRDGYMAFIHSPDQISIELLQEGDRLPVQEP